MPQRFRFSVSSLFGGDWRSIAKSKDLLVWCIHHPWYSYLWAIHQLSMIHHLFLWIIQIFILHQLKIHDFSRKSMFILNNWPSMMVEVTTMNHRPLEHCMGSTAVDTLRRPWDWCPGRTADVTLVDESSFTSVCMLFYDVLWLCVHDLHWFTVDFLLWQELATVSSYW